MSRFSDRLQKQIAQTGDVNSKLGLYKKLVEELQKSNIPRAIQICEEAITLACLPENVDSCHTELADCLFSMGVLNARSGKYLKAISIAYDALPLIEKLNNRYLHGRAINLIAVSNGFIGNFYEALNQFMITLEIFKEIGDRSWEAATLNNIGFQYCNMENYDWSLKYLSMSLEILKTLDNISLEADVYETFCNVYYAKGVYDESLDYGLNSLALYQELEDQHGESEVLNSLGDTYRALNQPEKALECYHRAFMLAQRIGHDHEQIEALLRLGEYHTSISSIEKAQENLNLALQLAEKLEINRSIYQCHAALMRLYRSTGDYEHALMHFEKFYEFHQRVFDESQTNRIQSLEIMHQVETARKDAEIYRLKNVALQKEIDERKKAQEALRRLAITDPLTRLYNRRYFYEVAEKEFKLAKSYKPQISLILVDVDHFKGVNDRYGHIVGDKVLMQLAEIIQESVRKIDIVARYGGEEFVIMLPDTDIEQAALAAERLCKTVARQSFDIDGYHIDLGVSVGVAYFNGQMGMDIETLLNHADHSMYMAKQAGGNRVQIWCEN